MRYSAFAAGGNITRAALLLCRPVVWAYFNTSRIGVPIAPLGAWMRSKAASVGAISDILVGGTLLLVGIKHALLIGVIFALLNLIPYIGALIGNVIGVLLTLASSPDLWPIFTVLGIIAGAQFLDNNILMPRIVGAKVRINALAAIVGVFTGGAIGGIMGMFLSLPTIAVLKVIFDRTENLQQWGVLFGDERPDHTPMHDTRLRQQNKEVKRELEEQNEIEPPKQSERPL